MPSIQTLLDSPALVPPGGVKPNFVNPPNLNTVFYVTILSCLVLPTVVLAVRLYTKACIIRKVVLEDYLILLALLFFTGFCVPGLIETRLGIGIHQWNLQLTDLRTGFVMYTVAAVLYGIPVFLTKLSILLQYLRIFNPHTYKRTNLMFWAPYALIWTNLGFYLVTSLIAIFGCKPIAKAWDPLITRGHCLNRHATAIAVAIINCLTDFMILVLPLRAIWNLQIPRRKKLAISSVFLVGVLSLAAATVRIYYCIRLIQSSDTSYYTALFSLTTFPEIGFGIIACCLPTMPRFVRALKKPQLSPKLASYITTGFYIIRPTKYRRSSRCSLKYNGNNVCKSDEVDARPKQSRRPSESLEMLTVPKRETHCEHTDDHCIHGPPADAHIMRTICIDTVEEPASSLAPYLHRHTGQPWDGQLQDYVQRTQSHK